jgi:hypothetical protein
LIKGHSKAKYYNPTKPDEHIPDVNAILRDEVGLIRAIAVKASPLCCEGHQSSCTPNLTLNQERSSAKRKELFRSIQSEKLMEKDHGDRLDGKNGCVKQLILDMPVRWSSTYGMLHHAVMLQTVKCHYSKINKHSTDRRLAFQSVDTFVSHMARDEPDRTKRAKLDDLQLSREEWDRVKLFLSLLKV